MKKMSIHRLGRKAQSGFTLVEIAIVLVIIGLLLGGVLKGQELIENGRVKSAAADMNGITAAYTGYLDRYRKLPGDDGPLTTLQARGAAWTVTNMAPGNNNGVLEATAANAFGGGGEGGIMFRHLRAAGFLSGDASAAVAALLPTNPWGGRVGVVNAPSIQGRPNANKLMVCMSNVPGKAATALDAQLDDGRPDGGTLRATLSAAAGNTVPAAATVANYSEDARYTICRDIG